jgi:ABC-2 type transport system permease protein
MIGFYTLFYKEILRFWKVSLQTIAAPIFTALMYLAVFGYTLQSHVQVYPGVSYIGFLIPGLVMMSALQNAFANSVSSLIISKVTGNLIFILLPPLGAIEILSAYVLAAVVRGVCVGLGIYAATCWLAPIHLAAPWYILAFLLLGLIALGVLGLIVGILAETFDQMAVWQNFLITPLTFLAGVFYSTHSLPPALMTISRLNPFFYMIDGFRYGFFGVSDIAPLTSIVVTGSFCMILIAFALRLLLTSNKWRG